jgi:ferredoxin-NADP reductase
VKFVENGSAFKRGLAQLQPGDTVVASQLAGSFTLPRNKQRKLAFIAGGIGITPFRSMLDELLERGEARDITVLYGTNRIDEIAYAETLERAREELGIETSYAVRDPDGATPGMTIGMIDEAMIRRCVPDFADRSWSPRAARRCAGWACRRAGSGPTSFPASYDRPERPIPPAAVVIPK